MLSGTGMEHADSLDHLNRMEPLFILLVIMTNGLFKVYALFMV